jgi:hypothetical protein
VGVELFLKFEVGGFGFALEQGEEECSRDCDH